MYLLKSHASKPGIDSARYLNIIDEETSRASTTIDNLMEMSRPKEPSKEEVDLGGLVRESCSRISDRIEWQVSLNPDPFVIHTDSAQLQQVLNNLISNSLEALDGSGKIEVDATRMKSHDRIIVRDDGPGIPRECRARLFEPLYSTKVKGTGLGLTICRQIIEQLGGTIGLLDEEEKGAAFEILLSRVGASECGVGTEE